ncbi:hypothetical protein G5B35_16520 [Parapusillimonas sp. SGNA-6]|nr:hypothetical protein [Parapusillimonas sp. SGNA-6]
MTKSYGDEAPMRRVAPLLIVLVAALAAILAAVAALDRAWGPQRNEAQPPGRLSPVGRMLETAPQPELRDYLAQKQRLARSYAWIDPARHLARIPVDEAMRALAASGTAPDARAAYLMGVEAPTTEGSGQDDVHEPQPRGDAPSAVVGTKGAP